jgi:V-type H+-transporting ATPase subunit D
MSREEFFRLKKVQGKKKRDADKANEEREANNDKFTKEGGETHKDDGIGGGDAGGRDMLDEGKDEDVIF